MKLADLTKDELIEKLRATKRKYRKTMKHLEQIHRTRETRSQELEADLAAIESAGLTIERDDAGKIVALVVRAGSFGAQTLPVMLKVKTAGKAA
jgi:hypothetical protein